MNIIRANIENLKEILTLCESCTKNMKDKSIEQWDENYPNEKVFEDDINKENLLIAVSEDNKILGCIVLNEFQDPEYSDVKWNFQSNKVAVIHRLMVHPISEGKGIAKEMLKFIENIATEKNYEVIRLDVFSKNPRAVKFYENLGYIRAGKVFFRKGEFFCYDKKIYPDKR